MTADYSSPLRERVHRVYSAAGDQPEGEYPFPVGRAFAERLGYPPELLADIPTVSLEAFSGVSEVFTELKWLNRKSLPMAPGNRPSRQT